MIAVVNNMIFKKIIENCEKILFFCGKLYTELASDYNGKVPSYYFFFVFAFRLVFLFFTSFVHI